MMNGRPDPCSLYFRNAWLLIDRQLGDRHLLAGSFQLMLLALGLVPVPQHEAEDLMNNLGFTFGWYRRFR